MLEFEKEGFQGCLIRLCRERVSTMAFVKRKSPPLSGETLIDVMVSVCPLIVKMTAFRRKSQAFTTFSIPPVYICNNTTSYGDQRHTAMKD